MKKNSEIEESTISITQAVYETAKGLYDIGCIDKAKFSEYEEMVLDAYENGELQSTDNFQKEIMQAKVAARNTLNNKAKTSTRDK